MYFDEVYKLSLEHFAKFCILGERNAKNHDFHGVYQENRLVGHFHYYIRNQRIEIRKYGENSKYCSKGRSCSSVRFSPSCLKKTVQCAATFHVFS